jgi:hypothetical protein
MKNAIDPIGNRTRELAISGLCENLLHIFHYLPWRLYIPLYCTWKLFYCYPLLSDFFFYCQTKCSFERLVPGLIVKLVSVNERFEMGLLFKHFYAFF